MTTPPHNPSNYQPVGEWSGRLIFNRDARLKDGAVLIEVHNAPAEYSEFIGREVHLGWATDGDKELKDYVDFLTMDVTFEDEAKGSMKVGRIHPHRLDGLKHVGPLESLAAARPENDIHVVLENFVKVNKESKSILISKPPVQIRGKIRCLAKFVKPSETKPDHYEIQHYNMSSKSFDDGEKETIKIPKFPKNNRGLYVSTSNQIENSPVNEFGWYLYGFANNTDENNPTFEVESWEPRRGLMISEQIVTQAVLGLDNALEAIPNLIWSETRYKKGRIESFLLDPNSKSMSESVSTFKEGDRFLVLHLFGGIGGTVVNEETPLGLIPGHFAFGNATIVKDSFTGELQFRIVHRQVYAHNNGGIISGPHMWSSYMGDLQRGWFGTRPDSDVIVQLDPMTKTYDYGDDTKVCPLDEIVRELNEMGARYRTGDGDGSALVSTAHSCVQDSNQALYAALNETENRFKGNPKIQAWTEANPNHEQTRQQKELHAVLEDLDAYLTPFGVRKDWEESAKRLIGTQKQTVTTTLLETMKTWRTVVPRRAHDRLSEIFLKHGARLWFIRTNQVGGHDPDIIPLAPARAFQYSDNRRSPEDGGGSMFCGCM